MIYLALEEGKRTIRDRLRIRAGDHTDLPIYVVFLDGSEEQTFRLDDSDSITALRDLVIECQPVLVVLDVLREAHDGRENESDDMAIMLRPIRQIAHEFNVTIVVTHHASKAGGFRGSTSIPAAFDDTVEFVRDDLDSDTQMRGMITGRGRDLPKVVQHIEFDPDTYRWRAIHGAPAVSQPTNIREKILHVLNATDDYLTAEAITEAIEGAKTKTVQNALSGLMGEQYRQLLVKGTGSKGDPRRYHGIHKREADQLILPGNDPGTKEQDTEPTCVQCGGKVVEGQMYCSKHGRATGPPNGPEETEIESTGNPAWDGLWDTGRKSA